MFTSPAFQRKLQGLPSWFISIYAALCSFGVYFCMYAFRKPFSSAGFAGYHFLHIDYKVWLVTAQVMGYMLSKFYGIRLIAGMRPERRAAMIVKLILVAWGALLLFALTPPPYNIVFLLVNGFPLGMVWGLVFGYLEGRKATEFMGAVLCTTFSLSSGVVKSVGKAVVIDWHFSEFWMPFITGALFVAPMVAFTWLLNQIPPPNAEDIRLRSVRNPMTRAERKTFVASFLPGIIIIVATYVLLTILRDFRDNFANELWTELGYGRNAAIFTQTEIPVSLVVLFSMSLLILVRSNIKAFMINHYIIIGGYIVAFVSTLLFSRQLLGPVAWMTLVGTGLYLSYVPFNCLYFERMIASYKMAGNVGFIMYIADAFGYLGSVLVLFVKQFIGLRLSWTHFFVDIVLSICLFGIGGTILAAFYFRKKYYAIGEAGRVSYGAGS